MRGGRFLVACAVGCAAGSWALPGCNASDDDVDADGDAGADGPDTLPLPETWLWHTLPSAGRGYANGVAETDDEGVVLVGWFDLPSPGGTSFVTRFDRDGGILWDRAIRGGAYAVLALPSGDFLVAGREAEAFLVRFSPAGVPRWKKLLGLTSVQALAPVGEEVLAAGDDGWVARLDQDGNPLWQERFVEIDRITRGGIAASRDGGVLVAGRALNPRGTVNVWVARLDAAGAVVWQEWASSPVTSNEGPGIAELPDGDLVVTYGSVGDVLVLRLDPSGAPRWEVLVGGPQDERGAMAVPGPDGGVIVAAMESSFIPDQPYNMWLFGLDASGTLRWQQTVVDPQPGTVHGLVPTRDGAFLAVSGGCCGSHVVKLRLDGSFDGECDGLTPTLGRLMRVPTAPIPATLVPDRTSAPAAVDVPVVAGVNTSTSELTCH